MKVIYNNFLPLKGFTAINLFGVLFARREYNPVSERTIRHEAIHTAQMKELGYLPFYILYFAEWIVRLFVNGKAAYRNISFEQEAYGNDRNGQYLKNRKNYAWLNFLNSK
jgi:hypothetical protein